MMKMKAMNKAVMESVNHKKWAVFVLIIVIAIIFYVQNTIVPFFSDDISLARDTCASTGLLDNVYFLIQYMYDFWLTTNGRIVNQFVWKVMCISGTDVFDVFNTFMFLMYSLLIVKLCVPFENKFHPFVWFVLLFCILYLVPDSDSLFYWAAGSLNYMFAPALAVGFFLLLRWLDNIENVSGISMLFISLYAFLAGMTHEVFSLPIALSLVIFILKAKGNIKKTIKIVSIFYVAGVAFVVFAPGTIIRLLLMQGGGDAPMVQALMNKLLQSFKVFRYGRLLYVLLFAIIYLVLFNRNKFKKFINEYAFLLLCTLFSFLIVFLLGVGGRAVCGVEFFVLLVVVNVVEKKASNTCRFVNFSYILLVLIISHQIYLTIYMKDAWQTLINVDKLAQHMPTKEKKVLPMAEWKSDNLLVDPFVAHPYEMMREDKWMRFPYNCEICRTDVYDFLNNKSNALKDGRIGDDYILLYSENLIDDIDKGKYNVILEPMTLMTGEGLFSSLWHFCLKTLFPERYPTKMILTKDNVAILKIGENSFLRIEKIYAPIPRNVINVVEND